MGKLVTDPYSLHLTAMAFYLLIIGFISILGQVVILRELMVAFYGVELIYVLAMGIWLLWTAIGALMGRKKHTPSVNRVRVLLLLFSILLPIEVAFIRGIRLLFGGIPGTYLPFGHQLIAIIITLIPIGMLLGLIFQWAAKLHIGKGGTLALAYALESAGAIVGGLASTLLLHIGVQNFSIAILCSMMTAWAGSTSDIRSPIKLLPNLFPDTRHLLSGKKCRGKMSGGKRRGQVSPIKDVEEKYRGNVGDRHPKSDNLSPQQVLSGKRWGQASQLIFGVLMVIFFLCPELDRRMTRWTHPHLLDTRDSPYSRITIEGRSGQFVVFENDVLGFETESTAAEELVHLAALQHDAPARVLIAGGGIEGIVGEILKHGPRRVDYVELNPALLDLAEAYLPEAHRKSLESEVVTIDHADPRAFLKQTEDRLAGAYDLILVGMPEPASGQSNRFYTREFFRQCADRLKPGGILAFRLRASENIWTPLLSYRNASIRQALTPVFHHVLVLPGMSNILLASNTPLIGNPAQLIRRLEKRRVKARLITPPYIAYLFTNDRFFEIRDRLSSINALPNTDIRPICYQYSSMIWLSKFIPGMIHWQISFSDHSNQLWIFSWICVIFYLLVLLFVRRCRPDLKRVLLVALAGFIGMLLETMLMLHYQVKSGVLFQNIGILLMVFMAGLSIGSVAVMRLAGNGREASGKQRSGKSGSLSPLASRPSPDSRDGTGKFVAHLSPTLGRGLFIGFGILSLIFVGLAKAGCGSNIFVISLLLFITGFLVSAVFAFASLAGVSNQNTVVAPLYAADLMGGCAASLIGSLIVIPFLGMEGASAMVTVLALGAVVSCKL